MTGRFEHFDARSGGSCRLVLAYADASAAREVRRRIRRGRRHGRVTPSTPDHASACDISDGARPSRPPSSGSLRWRESRAGRQWTHESAAALLTTTWIAIQRPAWPFSPVQMSGASPSATRWRNPVTTNAIGAPNTVKIRPGWVGSKISNAHDLRRACHLVSTPVRGDPRPRQRRPRSYRVEKRLVHVTPHPVHTPLFVGPGQGMASLAEMLSGVLVL